MKTWLTYLIPLLITSLALAHGENKPGPHGGCVRMPGSFHTEVVESKDAFTVYLLDVQWKNPTVENSSVQLTAPPPPRGDVALSCEKGADSFVCPKKGGTPKQIVVKSARAGAKGLDMVYEYPLKLLTAHH